GQCLLTCKATTWDDGHVVVQGPLEAFPGTHCTTATGGPGICISSVCTPIGCDGLAGSTKAVDKCGRCISPNLSNKVCSRNSGPITKNPTTGHVEMIRLPVGASTVSVTNHLPPRLASIMVRSETGDFLFTVGPPGHIFEAGGTEFEYHVSVEGGNFTESLTTNGTLNNSITIEVYIPSQRVAPSISYEYHSLENVETWGRTGTRDRGPPLLSPPNNIDWSYGPFLSCTETCTTGIQVAYAVCTDLDFNNRILPDNYCSGSEKPTPIVRHCGSGNCAPRWVTRDWLPCSQTRCGVGSQQRLVQCMVLEANGRDSMVTDDLCPLASKPRHERECLMTESTGCGTEWEEDEWGECCSTEPLERRIQCVDSGGAVQPPFFCSHLHRNSSLRPCEKGPCTNGGCFLDPQEMVLL
ncbi:A disintegrin and metalloproteinase with thrombospondin motifs 14, partial [Geodia barretti]